jgi:hypothetical protein
VRDAAATHLRSRRARSFLDPMWLLAGRKCREQFSDGVLDIDAEGRRFDKALSDGQLVGSMTRNCLPSRCHVPDAMAGRLEESFDRQSGYRTGLGLRFGFKRRHVQRPILVEEDLPPPGDQTGRWPPAPLMRVLAPVRGYGSTYRCSYAP